MLDPALTRPGRFDRQVIVDRPDLKGREAILKVHTRDVGLDPAVELRTIASRTPGFTGADLANVVNEAALLAARREKPAVGIMELEEAIDRVLVGPEHKSRVISEQEKRTIAVHEMGHALVALRVSHADPVHRVTIVPRGATALGMTMQRPLQDRYLMTEPELRDRLAVLLGGRCAEEIIGDISTGAQNDLDLPTLRVRSEAFSGSALFSPAAVQPCLVSSSTRLADTCSISGAASRSKVSDSAGRRQDGAPRWEAGRTGLAPCRARR